MDRRDDDNGWSKYERLVLYRLDGLEREVRSVKHEVSNLKKRSALWGALAGSLPGLLAWLAAIFR